ncbi:hypothetical protein [Prosthecobacter dejongeii]|uniref:hypothetical protein n=1 Tax=Prosthecobacter dejongeii TaxID=48465 RepID=UPI0016118092|nr:hypothetical protein [Prosthecobacter dejongeii]
MDEDVYRAIDGHYSWSPISDRVIFLIPLYQLNSIAPLLKKGRSKDRILINRSKNLDISPSLLVYDHCGCIRDENGKKIESKLIKEIRRRGCYQIFIKHQGMLEASDSHHYVKPSLKHTDRFMRTGSVLVNGIEIEFISLWLLSSVTNNTQYIYTDSSTINSIAYASVHLHNMLAPESARISPTIQSYESYKGLSSNTVLYKDQSLILISASSGGGMAKHLIDKLGISDGKIRTVFYLGLEEPPENTICDLTIRPGNVDGFPAATVTEVGDRGSFAPHSLAVHIQAEAFMPENPQIHDVNLKIEDIPKWWVDFKKSFVGRNAITCNVSDPADDSMSSPPPKPTIFKLDKACFNNSPFLKRLNQILLNSIAASLSYVIYFEDDSSKMLVRRIKSTIRKLRKFEKSSKNIKYIPARLLTNGSVALPLVEKSSEKSTLIVAGILTDGTQLLDVAQIARNFQQNHALSFLVGLTACASQQVFKEIRSNLVYSQSGVEFGFYSCCDIQSPIHHRQVKTPWEEEFLFWMKQLEAIRAKKMTQNALVLAIENRIGTIQEGVKNGLLDEVFMGSNSCSIPKLQLRNNSVYTEGLNQSLKFSQADAFFAIQATLHHLRTTNDRARKLEQQPHRRCVLSPSLFFRYSDGVIQSAILRAASHQELDYQMSQILSGQMADTISKILQSPSNPRAEALTEFLYALASRKIRLLKADLNTVYATVKAGLGGGIKSELNCYLCELLIAED